MSGWRRKVEVVGEEGEKERERGEGETQGEEGREREDVEGAGDGNGVSEGKDSIGKHPILLVLCACGILEVLMVSPSLLPFSLSLT